MIFEGDPTATDYVLVTGAYAENDAASPRAVIKFNSPQHIHGDIWIGEIGLTLGEKLLDACAPRGENFEQEPQPRCSYAFYRQNAPAINGQRYNFDTDNALYNCVALSRIVHPTAVGFENAARVLQWPDGRREIIPAEHSTINRYAFVVAPNENWLIPSDLQTLRSLLEAFHAGPPPERLASALWLHEAVARHHFIDLRWPLLTTCLEALVRIKDEKLESGKFAGSTKQFVDRLLAIGSLDATLAVSEPELRNIYEQRSLLVHGLAFGGLDEPRRRLYLTQERLALGIIRKAFLDPAFRAVFASDESVRMHLPLNPAVRRTKLCEVKK